MEALLHRVPVQAGDVIFVPAGTIHAIDAGITLFEIQQKSDLTYRVYDYGRRDARTGQPRALHLEKALDVSLLAPAPRTTVPPLPLGEARHLMVACPFFALEHWAVPGTCHAETDPGSLEILTVLAGSGTLQWEGGELALGRGVSVLLPAQCGRYRLIASDEAFALLRAYVPDLERDILAPLREQGVDEERIAATVAGAGGEG